MRKPEIMFAALVLISAAAVVVCLTAHRMTGVFVHDSNYEVFQNNLDEAQRRGITASVRAVFALPLNALVLTNLLWIAWAGYMLRGMRRSDRRLAESGPRD